MGEFGSAISLDGDTAIIGAPLMGTSVGTRGGAAYVFVRSAAGSWAQQARLVAPVDGDGDRFGHAVSIDGDVAIIGAPLVDITGRLDRGNAYIFRRSAAGVWAHEQTLSVNEYEVGRSVGISGDFAVIGYLDLSLIHISEPTRPY